MLRLGLIFVFATSLVQAVPEHYENPQFDAKKKPKTGIATIDEKLSKPLWKNALRLSPPSCKTSHVWKSTPNSKVTAIPYKNLNAPVKANFTRSLFFLSQGRNLKTLWAEGRIDLSSFNSGDIDRDRRIQRMIFEVEKPGKSVAMARAKFEPNVNYSDLKPGKSINVTMKTKFLMHGQTYLFDIPVEVKKLSSSTIQIKSTKKGKFTYATDSMKDRIMAMVVDCNHQFLASFVETEFDLKFEDMCQ